MAHTGIRGLSVFISDIRSCPNKDAERDRVNKELAKIRTKFKSQKQLTEYDRKKYVWKLLYIFMLGYEVDFGHMEALSLISCAKYPEKQVGYIATSVMLNESHDFLRLVINSIRNDIISRNEAAQCLGLTCVANVGGRDFAEALSGDVQKLLMTSTVRPVVRKKAALCLLRLFRKNPDAVPIETWGPEQMSQLLDDRDLGVLTAVFSLLAALTKANPQAYRTLVPKCVSVLDRLMRNKDVPTEWTYYQIPSPWLQIKVMQVLQLFPVPGENRIRTNLLEVLQRIMQATEVVKNVNRNNATHAILFEAVALVMHLDSEAELVRRCIALLGKFIGVREPNIRYLALENMSRLAILPEMLDAVRTHQTKILASLQDPDISIRRRALDLLFVMCDQSNVQVIMSELLSHLTVASLSVREELVLKMAVLAERYASEHRWYVDVMLALIEKGGEFVNDDIWHRVVQVITNEEGLQPYCARKAFDYLQVNVAVEEPMVKISCYILGEFGHTLAPSVRAAEIFDLVVPNLNKVGPATEAILVMACAKLYMHDKPRDPALKVKADKLFSRYKAYADEELQQRAVEFLAITARAATDPAVQSVLAEMPKYPERTSLLERSLQDKEEYNPALERPSTSATGGIGAGVSARNAEAGTLLNTAAFTPPKSHTPTSPAPPIASLDDLLTGKVPTRSEPARQPPTNGVPATPMDLLESLAPAAPTPAATATTAADPFAAIDDLLGGPASGVVAPAGASTVPPAAPTPLSEVFEWYEKLCRANSGVLYEDQYLQMGLKAMYKDGRGRVVLYIGNKVEGGRIEGLRCAVAPIPGLAVTVVSALPDVLSPKQQVQFILDVACQTPYLKPPAMHLGYTYTTPVGQVICKQELTLPVTLNKFLAPRAVEDRDAFFGMWRAIAVPPQKQLEVLLVKPALAHAGLQGLMVLLNSLSLNVVPGLDPNPNNLVTSAMVLTAGEPLICIVRLESDANNSSQFRLTVATPDAVATSAVKELVMLHIKNQA